MSFSDWTLTLVHTASGALDGVTKYAGLSSYKASTSQTGSGSATLEHNTFSESRAQIICWTRAGDTARQHHQNIVLGDYGSLCVRASVINTWQKWRVSFWYDSATDTKWGRRERWIGGGWVEQGSGDTNFGNGVPSDSALSLYVANNIGNQYDFFWFDELEVYS